MSSPGRRSWPGRAALTKRLVRLPTDGPRFFEVVSYGLPARFSPAQIDQISRTVRHTPEVMVKVTGGGARRGAVAAHLAYLSRQGTLEIETDEGEIFLGSPQPVLPTTRMAAAMKDADHHRSVAVDEETPKGNRCKRARRNDP